MTQKTRRKKGRPKTAKRSPTADKFEKRSKKQPKKTPGNLPSPWPTRETEAIKPTNFPVFEPTTQTDTLSVREAALRLGIGRNSFYALVAEGKVPIVRIGRHIHVVAAPWTETVAKIAAATTVDNRASKTTSARAVRKSNVLPFSGRPRRR